MYTANLNELELTEFITRVEPRQHCRATFPLLETMGSRQSAMVYVELEPGDSLGRHTDSAEETLLILGGTVAISVENETVTLSEGEFALVPLMAPHDIRNVGDRTARVVGFFGGANNIVASFDNTWLPTESNVVDTAAATVAK